jgi:dihydrodipicolinate synthase/N-acetylneuraminate lyase
MLTAQDLHGTMAMMPAFATPDAADINARSTIAVDNLAAGVDRIIKDGIDVISTSGSFGEFHTLLPDEFQTLVRTTIDVVNRRVPLFIGCTALNSREVAEKMRIARDAGAEGVLVGVPFYFPSTLDNAVRFYHDIAGLFPELAIMIYHNPALHNVTLAVSAFKRICENGNVVAMKDSHRTTPEFMKLMDVTKGRVSVFVNTQQYHPYADLGAAGYRAARGGGPRRQSAGPPDHPGHRRDQRAGWCERRPAVARDGRQAGHRRGRLLPAGPAPAAIRRDPGQRPRERPQVGGPLAGPVRQVRRAGRPGIARRGLR